MCRLDAPNKEDVWEIHPLREADCATSAALYCSCFREPPWYERFESTEVETEMCEMLAWPDAVAFAAVDGFNRLIGAAWGFRLERKPDVLALADLGSEAFYFAEVFVDSKRRERGAATRLVIACLKTARERGMTRGAVRTSVCQPIIQKLFVQKRDWKIVAMQDVESEKDFGQGMVRVPDRRVIMVGDL